MKLKLLKEKKERRGLLVLLCVFHKSVLYTPLKGYYYSNTPSQWFQECI
jgi:hypothetical protein